MRCPVVLITCLFAAACAGGAGDPQEVRIDPVVVHQVAAQAAHQVRRCYRPPRVASEGRQIVTRLAVRYAPDGQLAAVPALVSQSGVTPTNSFWAARMAEAATAAVIRCAPLRLPSALYAPVWRELELTFSPSRRV